jgi:oligosaccharide repeat unit polymerase
MTSSVPSTPFPMPASLPLPAAAFEVLGYLSVAAVASLWFIAGWLTPNGAVVVTVVFLVALIALSWIHLGRGRHPCFLFLCTLMLFQGGRMIAFCLGAEPEPLRIMVMTPYAFNLTRDEQGIVLLCLTVSAVCVYAPCRWNFRSVLPPDSRPVRRYLPYLYLVLFVGLPFLLFKNYRFYEYAQQHGGYTFMFSDPSALAANVPFLVRSVSAMLFPVFLAIYVFETRPKYLFLATVLYFATTSIILLLGARGAVFQLIVTLWYVTRVKSKRSPRILLLCTGVLVLVQLAGTVRAIRESSDDVVSSVGSVTATALIDFIDLQGSSLDVTQVAVKYRDQFAPNAASYLLNELQSSYVSTDARSYSRGKLIDSDIAVLLSSAAFDLGFGAGGSYLGEAYIVGGFAGVVIVSLGIGFGLHLLYLMARRADSLFVSATLLFSAIWLARGDLLAWLSGFSRNMLVVLFLWIGWLAFRLITSIRHSPGTDQLSKRAPIT